MSKHKVEISAAGPLHTSIRVDGRDISQVVSGYTLSAGVGRAPLLTLTLPALERADVAEEMNVVIKAATADLLVSLGWTPPLAVGA